MKTCVLDIETIPNTRAMAAARYLPTDDFAPWPLHEIDCASILIVGRTGRADLSFSLRSYSRGGMSERGIITRVHGGAKDRA